ncbi:MAG: hypothetical protein AAF802_20505 [Planctomycetota bacterium]
MKRGESAIPDSLASRDQHVTRLAEAEVALASARLSFSTVTETLGDFRYVSG